LRELFFIVDVSAQTRELQADISRILEAFEMALRERENEPEIEIGKQCNNPSLKS